IHVYRDHRDLHSFPTRRSSDLIESGRLRSSGGPEPLHQSHEASAEGTPFPDPVLRVIASLVSRRVGDGAEPAAAAMTGVGELLRSEEHTSELQSLAYLVCRLLL